MVASEALALLGIGAAAGVTAGVIAARLVSSELFGLRATDAVTICGAVATMLVVTCLAGLLPARRASHVDPMVALRSE
jgi:ABC-type antimicrobial peptide transport system permease subunit